MNNTAQNRTSSHTPIIVSVGYNGADPNTLRKLFQMLYAHGGTTDGLAALDLIETCVQRLWSPVLSQSASDEAHYRADLNTIHSWLQGAVFGQHGFTALAALEALEEKHEQALYAAYSLSRANNRQPRLKADLYLARSRVPPSIWAAFGALSSVFVAALIAIQAIQAGQLPKPDAYWSADTTHQDYEDWLHMLMRFGLLCGLYPTALRDALASNELVQRWLKNEQHILAMM